MVSRKQVRSHQKKERKKRLVSAGKKLLFGFLQGSIYGLGTLAVHNFDSIFKFLKELFSDISNSRYKIQEVYSHGL